MIKTLWDTTVQLTDNEIKIQEKYAKAIVKSIVSRVTDPKDMKILISEAMHPSLAVAMEFALQEDMKESKKGSDD